PETERAQLLVEGGVAVLVVSRNGVRGVLCVYADLMSAARAQPDLHEGRRPAEELDRPELAHRGLSRGRRTHRALTADPRIGAQRNIDALGSELPLASDEREVALLDPAFTHERVETAQRGRVACDEQAPARVAMEAMDQLETLVRTERPQRLDHAEAQPAAAVDRNPGGLVEPQQPCILVDDRLRNARAELRRGL